MSKKTTVVKPALTPPPPELPVEEKEPTQSATVTATVSLGKKPRAAKVTKTKAKAAVKRVSSVKKANEAFKAQINGLKEAIENERLEHREREAAANKLRTEQKPPTKKWWEFWKKGPLSPTPTPSTSTGARASWLWLWLLLLIGVGILAYNNWDKIVSQVPHFGGNPVTQPQPAHQVVAQEVLCGLLPPPVGFYEAVTNGTLSSVSVVATPATVVINGNVGDGNIIGSTVVINQQAVATGASACSPATTGPTHMWQDPEPPASTQPAPQEQVVPQIQGQYMPQNYAPQGQYIPQAQIVLRQRNWAPWAPRAQVRVSTCVPFNPYGSPIGNRYGYPPPCRR